MNPELAPHELLDIEPAAQTALEPVDTVLPPEPEGDIVILHPRPHDRVARLDPLSLLSKLKRHAEPQKIEDKGEKSRMADQTALYLQDRLLHRSEQEQDGQLVPLDREFSQAFDWLRLATEPATAHICRTYASNSRADTDDFRQVIYTSTIQDFLPRYDPSRSSYFTFFKAVAWRRVQDYASKSASQLSTVLHFGKSDPQLRQRALTATSYNAFEGSGFQREPEELMPGSDDVVRSVACTELLGKLATVIDENLSTLERKSLLLFSSGLDYGEVAAQIGVSKKVVDNALQRASKKLKIVNPAAIEDSQ